MGSAVYSTTISGLWSRNSAMARPSIQRTCAFLLFSIIRINLFPLVLSAVQLLGDRPPMVLPLYLSSPNRSFDGYYRLRSLKESQLPHNPIARMRLYDDLLSNGYYTTRLWIGTPPQEFALIVDTGSTVTYVPCSTCKQCGKHQDPRFKPEASTTYQPIKCTINCNCDSAGVQCTYKRSYAEMSSSSGVLGDDVVFFGNESELVPQHAVFGCENIETGDLYRQRADGIMGLGRGRLSIVDQLVDKDVISDSFSLCYGGMDIGGGAMMLGGISPPPDMVFSRSDPYRSPYYNIELKEIHVAGEPLKLRAGIFDGKHGTILDSGTTYAYLPEEAFVAFKDAISKKIQLLKQIPGPDPNYKDICFSGAGRDVSQLSKTFPVVDMVFGNGQKFSLSPENYLFRHSKVSGAYCLGVFQNGKDPTTLLGGILVRNTFVTYDREKDRIGFWKTNCSELWKKLQFPDASASPPLVSNTHNSSSEMPPTQTPNGFSHNVIPGELRIEHITFDLSLTINNSEKKPNFTELAEFIAHELKINASQVHLLDVTSKRNFYIIRWGIFPAESANYISNTAATNMILQLKEHHMQLPERFGHYQLVEWNIKPLAKPGWWKQHFIVVAVGVSVMLVFCVSTIGLWLVWRHKQQTHGTYQPVGGIVSERELQPL